MALSHLHLILNHVPVIGTAIALGLLLLALVRRSADLRRAGLEILVIVGFLTLPVYLTGLGAQREVADLPGVAIAAIRAHHDAALLGALFLLFTGIAAWIGLWQTRRTLRPAPGVFAAVLLLTVVALALIGLAANLGGQIRHPETTALQAVQNPVWLTAAWIAEMANTRFWVWPAGEVLHFIGLWLLFGILLVVNLRLLGVMKQASFPTLHGLLPWAMLGLTINVVTGMMFVIAMPGQYDGWPFYWKIVLLMVGAFNLLYLTIADATWKVSAGDPAPVVARILAGAAIVAWLAVMYFGRMLPFLGHSF
jgi:hypothetical protein